MKLLHPPQRSPITSPPSPLLSSSSSFLLFPPDLLSLFQLNLFCPDFDVQSTGELNRKYSEGLHHVSLWFKPLRALPHYHSACSVLQCYSHVFITVHKGPALTQSLYIFLVMYPCIYCTIRNNTLVFLTHFLAKYQKIKSDRDS